MIPVVVLIFAFYGATNYYIGRRLFVWLQLVFPSINVPLFAALQVICALSPFVAVALSYRAMGALVSAISGIVGRFADLWMGVYFYLLLVTAVVDLLVLLLSLVRAVPVPTSDSVRFFSGLLVVCSVVSIVSYGIYNGNQLRRVQYHVQTRKNVPKDRLRIVLLSDLHLGYRNGAEYLQKVVAHVRDIKPDLVCIAGDIFNGSVYALFNAAQASAVLRSIESTYGVYASLGNHDAGPSYPEMLKFFEQSGIQLLSDKAIVVADSFVLAGRKDPSPIGSQGIARTSIRPQLEAMPPGLPVIVMDHRPTSLSEYGIETDLVLSGHTHRGQVFPANLITRIVYEVDYGHYQKDPRSPHLIVSSGAATWGPPMRVGTTSEVVEIIVEKVP